MSTLGVKQATDDGPLVIFHEMQRRHLWTDDPDLLPLVFEQLDRVRAILRLARMSGWPIGHVLHRAPEGAYDPCSADWRPIEGFEPVFSERVYVIHDHSAFSNPRFESLLRDQGRRQPVLIGINGAFGCVETLNEARVRGIPMTCINDFMLFEQTPDMDADADILGWAENGIEATHFLERFARNDLIARLASA